MSNAFYKDIVDNIPLGYAYNEIIVGENDQIFDLKILAANKLFKENLNLGERDIVGKRATEVYLETYQAELFSFLAKLDEQRKKKHAKNKWSFTFLGYEIKIYLPRKNHILIFLINATAEKEQLELLERFFAINLDLLCVVDSEGKFLKLNQEWEWVLGYPLQEIKRKSFFEYVHPDDLAATRLAFKKLNNNEQVFNFTNRYRRMDGTYRYLEWRAQPDGDLIYGAARDITKHKSLQHDLNESKEKYKRLAIELRKSANYDQLTNLPNRRLFFERLRQEIKQSEREKSIFALMFIDLDEFKSVNDQHGHEIGDKLLIETAARISACIRGSDT